MKLNKIYEVYKSTNLFNYTLENLNSENKAVQQWAIDKVLKQNFKNENDVKIYVAMNI